jgi:hypothetical protein
MTKRHLILVIIFTINIFHSKACTIFSAKDKNGNIWTGSNADKPFSLSTFFNIVARTKESYGFYYTTNSNQPNEFPQGGMNEAGLSFEGNSVPLTVYKDFNKKKDFPGGSSELMLFIFKRCKTVKEVFELFKIYRVPGLEVSQFHFADKYGNFGIIVADSMWLTQGNYQISTNYNLCHPDKDSINCWRFPIVERALKANRIGLDAFRDLCDSTSQRKWTNDSQIKNLNTGEIWFYYAQNFSRPYKTNLQELLKRGTTSFYFYELFKDDLLVKQILQSKETENQFFFIILATVIIILLLTIYILTIKRRLKKIINQQTKNYR